MIERDRPERRAFIPRRVLIGLLAGVVVLLAALIALPFFLSPAQVEVPDLIGVDEDVARVRLAQSDLAIEVTERPFDPAPAGTVLSQDPPPGASISAGDTVFVVVSAGSEEFTMPDVIGLTVRIARAQLEQRGLTVRIDSVDSDAPKDTVLASNPAPGATVRTSDIIRLTVAAEGSATDALLPYSLQGLVCVLDPATVESGTVDVPMEVARRLQSLLEASGSLVHISRSASATDTTTAGRLAEVSETAATLVVGFDVPSSGPGGVRVLTLTAASSAGVVQPSEQLADALIEQLAEVGTMAKRATTGSDLVLQAFPAPGVRVNLGSQTNAEDQTLFRDPAWSDTIARALYRGIGERFGSQ